MHLMRCDAVLIDSCFLLVVVSDYECCYVVGALVRLGDCPRDGVKLNEEEGGALGVGAPGYAKWPLQALALGMGMGVSPLVFRFFRLPRSQKAYFLSSCSICLLPYVFVRLLVLYRIFSVDESWFHCIMFFRFCTAILALAASREKIF